MGRLLPSLLHCTRPQVSSYGAKQAASLVRSQHEASCEMMPYLMWQLHPGLSFLPICLSADQAASNHSDSHAGTQ